MASELPLVIAEELLCCALCMRSYREPRILPCLHSFCQPCLENRLASCSPRYAEQLARETQQLSPLPEGNEEGLSSRGNSPETGTETLRLGAETEARIVLVGKESVGRLGAGAEAEAQSRFGTETESKLICDKKSNSKLAAEAKTGSKPGTGAETEKSRLGGEEGSDSGVKTSGGSGGSQRLGGDPPTTAKASSLPRCKDHPPLPHKPPGLVVPPLPPGAVVKRTPAGAAVLVPKPATTHQTALRKETQLPTTTPPSLPRTPEIPQEVNRQQILSTSPPLLPRVPETLQKVNDEQILATSPPLFPRSPETFAKSSLEVTKDIEHETLACSPPLHPRSPETFPQNKTPGEAMSPRQPLPKDVEIPENNAPVPPIPAPPSGVVPGVPPSKGITDNTNDTHEQVEEGYYEECEVYEEVEQNPDKIIIHITEDDGDDNEDDGNFYYCAEPQDPKTNPEKEPPKNNATENPEKNEKEEVEMIEKAPKPSKGWFIGNIFRRSSPKKEKTKVKKPDITIKRSKSAPDASCVIRELPPPPTGALSPYSPSPTIGRPLPQLSEDVKKSTTSLPLITGCAEMTPEGTPALPPRNAIRQPPPLPTKRSISLAPTPTTVPTTPTPSVLSLPILPSQSPFSGAIPQTPFSGGNPSIVKCPNTVQLKDPLPTPQSQPDLRMNCPTCQTEFIVPSVGIRGLKANSFALSLQEVVLSQSSDLKNCNNCESSPAKFRCLDCRHYLCSGCRNAHNWLKITKSHRVMTLGELQSGRYQRELTQKQEIKCDIHKQNKVELMCLYCDKPICSECKIHEHFEHRAGHLNEAADRDRDLITSLINSVKDQMTLFHDTKAQLAHYDLQCNNEKKELIEGLGKQRDLIIRAVNDAFLDLVQEIDTAYTQEKTNADSVKQQMDSTLTHMGHNCMLAEQLLAHGKTEDILLMSRLMKVNLNNFSFAAPFELDTRAFVQYSPTGFQKPMLVSLFGRLAKRRSDIVRPKHIVQHRILEKGAHQASDDFVLLHSYRAKTLNDALGCKPSGLTVSMNDDIVIVDDTNKKVKVFDPSGIVKMELKPVGEHAFIDPWDVTITYQGYLAVTDRGARRVKVFDSRGRFVYEFGPHLKSPWGIAANSHGHLIVTDILAKAVFVHDQAGNLLHQIECKGHRELFVCPEYVKINHNDDIIVSDFMKHCITVFDSQGRFLFRYGTRGAGIHEFTTPCGIGVNKNGHILVADYSNKRIHELTRDGQFIQFILGAPHGLVIPQTVSVNSEGHLVVVDGTNIKTFGVLHDSHDDDGESDVDPIYEPLQFSNKLYEGASIRFSRAISESDA